MRMERTSLRLAMCVALWAGFATAEIVDRISVVIANSVIKQSDILSEIRVTDFLNGVKLDLGITAQKEAASRLIDQKIIRKAMEAGLYRAPSRAEVDQLLQQIRQRFASEAAYRRELNAYGISVDLLKEHLLWQIAVVRFVGLRFQGSDADAVNQQFFTWLDESRKTSRIDFKVPSLQGESK